MKFLALFALADAFKRHAECMEEAHKLLFLHEDPLRPKDTTVSMLVERGTDYCALKESADKKYFCKYFADFITTAFAQSHPDAKVTAASFCKTAEDHAGRMGTELEALAGWDLTELGFGEAGEEAWEEACVNPVKAAMAPDASVAKDKVADFWYLFCIHYHDCETAIPSRTKWCHSSHAPVISAKTCELLRADVVDLTVVKPQDSYTAENLCSWFLGFAGQEAFSLEAYEYVMYDISANKSLIPVPGKPEHALTWSRLTNGANGNWIRDHSAHPVTHSFIGEAKEMVQELEHSFIHSLALAPAALIAALLFA
jgi:hypothetical protein